MNFRAGTLDAWNRAFGIDTQPPTHSDQTSESDDSRPGMSFADWMNRHYEGETDEETEPEEQQNTNDDARPADEDDEEQQVPESHQGPNDDDDDDDEDDAYIFGISTTITPKPDGADDTSDGRAGGRSVFERIVGGFGPWVNPGRHGHGRATGGGRVLETRGDLAPWVYGDPRGGGRSGGRGAIRDIGLDPWTNPKRDDQYGDGGRGVIPVNPGTDPVAGFRNLARDTGSSQSSLALAMGINPAALEEFE